MPLSMEAAASRGTDLLKRQGDERALLDPVRRYWKGRQRLPAIIPDSAPAEVREMARLSRVNVVEIVVASIVQSLIVEGFRAEQEDEDGEKVDKLVKPIWDVWQKNRMDKRHTGVNAAATAYGSAYTVTLPRRPGRSDPSDLIIRGMSPRRMTALYGDDLDWPVEALYRVEGNRYNLLDDEAVYRLRLRNDVLEADEAEPQRHSFGVTPVVRYEAEDDLDADDEPSSELAGRLSAPAQIDVVLGQVAPLTPLQDQIDTITFNLMVAQHYTAFRQRYVIGWTDAKETSAMKAAASTLWAFKDHPDDMRIGEFGETDLKGYIDSREHALKYAATLSQTPVHELIGQMINMAADALAAAEAGRDRKIGMFKISLGESYEQQFSLIGRAIGQEVPDDGQVVWRDTSARAFSAVVQGLGMLATQLGMPPQELWDRVPGFTQQDIRRMKATAAEGDSLDNLVAMLDRQAGGGERQTESGLILPPGASV